MFLQNASKAARKFKVQENKLPAEGYTWSVFLFSMNQLITESILSSDKFLNAPDSKWAALKGNSSRF